MWKGIGMPAIIGIVALVIVVGIVLFASRQPADIVEGPHGEMPGTSRAVPAPVVLHEQNNSGESGTALLLEENGKLKVMISLTGAPAGVPQPAHIHTGTCANLGGVDHPLTPVVDGKSDTALNIPPSHLTEELPLAVNVHKSAAEAGVYVACGDITPELIGAKERMVFPDGEGMMTEKEGDAMMEKAGAMMSGVKIFSLTGRNFAFSQTEIRVKKGDKVKIDFQSTEGFHDWTVDGFSAKTAQVNTGGKSSVEFVADKAGTFEYYCSVGTHRALGMVGKLVVE